MRVICPKCGKPMKKRVERIDTSAGPVKLNIYYCEDCKVELRFREYLWGM